MSLFQENHSVEWKRGDTIKQGVEGQVESNKQVYGSDKRFKSRNEMIDVMIDVTIKQSIKRNR
jgi:hypothetical protein